MTQITVQDGKVVMRDGKVGTGEGCCCEGCGCCEDDSFLDSEVINGDCVYIKVSQLLLVAGGGSGVTFGAFLSDYGITKKEASPERDCIESARVYVRSAHQTNILDEACRGTRETRIYIPDCGSQTLIDITSDYDAPAGVFDVVIEDLPWTFPCHCPPDVPPLPRLPVCNPLP